MNALILELVGGPLRAMRRATFWWCLGLSALVAATISIWPAFRGSSGISQAIDQLPSGVVQAFGLADFGTPAGFLRANLYGFFVPLLIVIAAVVLANGQTASEEASGRMELYLAQPIDRRSALLGRAVAAVMAVVVICLVLGLAQLKRLGRRRRRVGRWRWWRDRRHRLRWRGFLRRRRRRRIFGGVVVGLHRQHFSDVLQLFVGRRDGVFLERKLNLPIVANILVGIAVDDKDDAVVLNSEPDNPEFFPGHKLTLRNIAAVCTWLQLS